MPKETITTTGTNHSLILRWGKNGNAILGVDLNNKFNFIGDDEVFTGLWFEFESREEINRLIKILRKVRDDTFGKDA